MRLERVASGNVEWWTPLPLILELGWFDLDPCAARGHKTAKRMICLPEDGLRGKWSGRVWLNPPYGRGIGEWLKRLAEHGHGTAIVPARTQTEWFQKAGEKADSILFIRKKVRFLNHGKPGGCPIMGSALMAFGREDTKALSQSGISGLLL